MSYPNLYPELWVYEISQIKAHNYIKDFPPQIYIQTVLDGFPQLFRSLRSTIRNILKHKEFCLESKEFVAKGSEGSASPGRVELECKKERELHQLESGNKY